MKSPDKDLYKSLAEEPVPEEFLGLRAELDSLNDCLRFEATEKGYETEDALKRALSKAEAIGSEVDADRTFVGNPNSQSAAPQFIRDYQLLEKLGQGGMGAVYKALHTKLNKTVALKILPSGLERDELTLARFKREMKAVGQLHHPNIVAAFDAGEDEGCHFLVMELIAGDDLSQLSSFHGPLNECDACEIVRQAAVGLQEAHEHDMVHRDIKPSNLMLEVRKRKRKTTASVKVLDMGLALLTDAGGGNDLTSTGQLMGTLDYMAPEQADDTHTVDIRADIYSLGATLYKLLTGSPPFEGKRYNTTVKRLMAILNDEPVPLIKRRPNLSKEVCEVVNKMMAKSPADRYASPEELAEALAPLAEGHNIALLGDKENAPQPAGSENISTEVHAHIDTEPTLNFDAPTSVVGSTEKTLFKADAASTEQSQGVSNSQVAQRDSFWTRGKVAIAGAVLATVGVLLGVVIFLQKGDTTIRVEITDPDIEIRVKNGDVLLFGERTETIKVEPGDHTLKITRGDFSFETDKFALRKGEEVSVKIELIEGAIQVVKNGEVLNSETFREEKNANSTDPTQPSKIEPVASGLVKNATWERGSNSLVLGGAIPSPRQFEKIGRWQIADLTGGSGKSQWSPDGSLIACPVGGFTHVIDANTLQRKFSLAVPAYEMAWSPDSSWLVVIGNADQSDIVQRGIQFVSRNGVPGAFVHEKKYLGRSVRWAPDSSAIIVTGGQYQCLLTPEGETTFLQENEERILDVAWTSGKKTTDNKTMATCGDSWIQFWDNSGKRLKRFKAPFRAVDVEWSPDEESIVVECGSTLYAFSTEGEPLWEEPIIGVTDFAWSPDQRILAVAAGKSIQLYDREFKLKKTLQRQDNVVHFRWRPDSSGFLVMQRQTDSHYVPVEGEATALNVRSDWNKQSQHERYFAWNADGTRAVVALFGNVLFGFEGQTPKRMQLDLAPGYGTHFVKWDPQGERFVISRTVVGNLQMYDSEGGFLGGLTHPTVKAVDAAISNAGDRIALANNENFIQILGIDGAPQSQINANSIIRKVEWHPGDSHLLYCDSTSARVVDCETNKVVASLSFEADFLNAAFEPINGDTIAVSYKNECILWRWRVERTPQNRFTATSGYVTWSPDGKSLLITDTSGEATRYDLTGKSLGSFQLKGPVDQIQWSKIDNRIWIGGTEYSPSGELIGADDGLKATNGEPFESLPDSDALKASPNGKHMIQTKGDRVMLWDRTSGELDRIIQLLPENQYAIFSPAGELLYGSPKADEHLGYLVEETNGRISVLSHDEFLKRVGIEK